MTEENTVIAVLENRDFPTAEEFVAEFNRARLARPRTWLTYAGKVAGRETAIKTYDCGYLQVFRIDDTEQAAPMDMKPTAWKRFILAAFGR